MKSIRLNKSIRKEIVSNIKDAYLNENNRPDYIEDAKADLDAQVISAYMTKYAELFKEYEASKFKGSYKTCNAIGYINTAGFYCYAHPTTTEVDGIHTYDQTLLDADESGVFIDLSNKTAKLPSNIKKCLADVKKLREVRKVRNAEISAYDLEMFMYINDVSQIIDGTNTTGQLITVWPEVEKFFPKGAINPSVITLPSVNINALNRKLGTAP